MLEASVSICILAARFPVQGNLRTETATGVRSSSHQVIVAHAFNQRKSAPQSQKYEGAKEAAQPHVWPSTANKEEVWPYILTAVINLHQVAFIVDLPSLFGIEAGLVQHHSALLASDYLFHKHLFPTQSEHSSYCALKLCS